MRDRPLTISARVADAQRRAAVPTTGSERDLVMAVLCEIRVEQLRQGAVLDTILQAVERRAGLRDAADAALLLAIREAVADRLFSAKQLLCHAAVDAALRDALLAADLVDARDVGTLFRRLQGVTATNGLRIERVADSRDGAVWCVRL